MNPRSYTVLTLEPGGPEVVARGTELAQVLEEGRRAGGTLIFDDHTGQRTELGRGDSWRQLAARLHPEELPTTGPGRPKLGVVGREVSLLPRHWEWLSRQKGGASATIRRLVDEARRGQADAEERRIGQDALYRVMTVLAGDLPGYEEALRDLYAGRWESLRGRLESWPAGVSGYLLDLLKRIAGVPGGGAAPLGTEGGEDSHG